MSAQTRGLIPPRKNSKEMRAVHLIPSGESLEFDDSAQPKRLRNENYRKYILTHKFLKMCYNSARGIGLQRVTWMMLNDPGKGGRLFGDIVVYIDPRDVRNLKEESLRGFKRTQPFVYDVDTYAYRPVKPAEEDHPTMTDIFLRGKPYWKTEDYLVAVRRMQAGKRVSKGLHSVNDLNNYFEDLFRLYELFLQGGYRPQKCLGRKPPFEEIDVCIDEKGGMVKIWGNGTHRFALARILGLSSVPVKIIGVHRTWMNECLKRYQTSPLYGILQGIRENENIHDVYYTEVGS